MSARRLGRLIGSVLMLAAIAGGVFAVEVSQIQLSGYDWGAGSLSSDDSGLTNPFGYDWG